MQSLPAYCPEISCRLIDCPSSETLVTVQGLGWDDALEIIWAKLNEKLDTRIKILWELTGHKSCQSKSSNEYWMAHRAIIGIRALDHHFYSKLWSSSLLLNTPDIHLFPQSKLATFSRRFRFKTNYAKWPTNDYHSEKMFRKAINKAAARHII